MVACFTVMSVWAAVLAHTTAAETCVDNDAKIVELANEYGVAGVSGCVDVGGHCAATNNNGAAARKFCCASCKTNGETTMSLPPIDANSPVQLFLLSGQSECTGGAEAAMLNSAGQAAYPQLVGKQTGVWFAGLKGRDFLITPMEAGVEKSYFGPEISFGQRVHQITGARVMVVKYCWGGSSTATHWNPATAANSWDHNADDGTAAWLKANGGVDLSSKDALFVNQVYVARRSTEALKAAGVAYEWKSIVWVQGSADKKSTWEVFGTNTARLFDAIRAHAVGVWNLPIVDTGSSAQASLRSGKAYAGQLVKGCKVTTIEMGAASENPDSTCQIGPTNPCLESTFFNFNVMNHYGYDPLFPDNLKPAGASNKKFAWYKTFPSNMHSQYEGMILKGRMLADEYVRAFTTTALPQAMAAEDPALLFPWPACSPADAKPTADKLCWMDLRGEVQAAKACVPKPPAGTTTSAISSTSSGTGTSAGSSTSSPVATSAALSVGASGYVWTISFIVAGQVRLACL